MSNDETLHFGTGPGCGHHSEASYDGKWCEHCKPRLCGAVPPAACQCGRCLLEAQPDADTLPISRADRHVILQGLSKLSFGYARELAERIEATKCAACGGDGFAAYIGGDDTDDGCPTCDGTGFR